MTKKNLSNYNNKSLIFFDSECFLCLNSIRIIVKFDNKGQFLFSSIYGQFYKEFIESKLAKNIDSIVLYADGKIFTKSEAVFRIIENLNFPLNLLKVLKHIPRVISDFIYDLVARYRKNLFKSKCEIIPSEFSNLIIY